jgi:hypothetical protein
VTPFTVAIMQPYFLPYAGYFRLFAASDLFVIYDCVQFPRRGWVHRNVLLDASGAERWLTLPLEKAPQSALIRDLRFPPDIGERLAERLRPFSFTRRDPASFAPILATFLKPQGTPLDYIEQLLELTVAYCGLRWQVISSSTWNVPAEIRGQNRILEIARRVGAKRYVNAPGGRDLYDPASFDKAGIKLSFLIDYTGPKASILTRMMRESRDGLADDIRGSAVVSDS